MTTVRKRLERLTDNLLWELTSVLALAHQVRPLPSIIQRWRDKMEAALIEAMLIGKHEAREELEQPEELADTRPLKTQPPPPKK